MEISDMRVLIVADDPLVRAGLAALLADQPGCNLVGQLDGDGEWLAEMETYQPEVILWDLGWDPAPKLEQVYELAGIELPLVILLPDSTYVAEVWVAGIRAILARDTSVEKLVAALWAAAQELITLDPDLAQALFPPAQADRSALAEELTPRESEVLQLLAEGLPNKSIARRLDISEHTVKFHVNAILGKLGAQSRTEAVVRATQLGLILL